MRIILSILLLLMALGAFAQQNTDHWRPVFHFSPQKNWINDPNGLVYFEGEYHLFFQHNPTENQWGNMSWGHAVSKDLFSWTELPVAIPQDSVWIFSGCVVIDKNNTSGFGTGNKPCMVAIYTADHHGKYEDQHLAYSNDKGRTWTKFGSVLDLNHAKDFRDPNIIWHNPSQQWVMSVVAPTDFKVLFYGSKNLKNWEKLGEFGKQGDLRKIWECPALMEVAVEGKKTKKWVLLVSSNGPEEGYVGMQYFVGDFDGKTFNNSLSPKQTLYIDYGKDHYAAVPFYDAPNQRNIILGWMSSWQYAGEIPTFPWKGQMNTPRELSLYETPEGLRLRQKPVKEIAKIGQEKAQLFENKNQAQLNDILANYSNKSLMIEATFVWKNTEDFGFKLATDDRESETIVSYSPSNERFEINRQKSGEVIHPAFMSKESVKVLKGKNTLKMQLLLDRCSIEAFINDGKTTVSDLIFPRANSPRNLKIFGKAQVKRLSIRALE